MDKKTASIFINGKLDAMKSTPPPAPCLNGEIMIGHCSGAGYFDGVFTYLGLFRGYTKN